MNALRPALALALLAAGCRSKPEVRYGDPTGVETLTVDFGSTDLQKIAGDLAQSMLHLPLFAGPKRPTVYVGNVENATREHLDTKNVTDSIQTTLIKSGKVQFAADTQGRGEIGSQLEYQRGGAVTAETAVAVGRQVGASHVLYGRLTSIEKKSGDEKDVFFKFTLNLVNVESGILEWKDEVEIRKSATRRSVGW